MTGSRGTPYVGLLKQTSWEGLDRPTQLRRAGAETTIQVSWLLGLHLLASETLMVPNLQWVRLSCFQNPRKGN